ncbi:MAG: CHASE3 domain-containing protein [Blastocatellia bacterium]
MKWSLDRRIAIRAGLVLLVLAVNAFISISAARTLVKNEELVAHTHEVIAQLEATLSSIKDAETGQRGYLLTGRETYLEPFNASLSEINEHLKRLRELTEDNQSQQPLIRILESKVAYKLSELNETIALRKTQGAEAAMQVVLSDRGKQAMGDIREVVGALKDEERSLLNQRYEQSSRSLRPSTLTFVVASLLAVTLLIVVTANTMRELARQQKSEAIIREQREMLQVTLSSIGDAVIATDKEGCVTFINPVAESLTGYSREKALRKPLEEVFQIVNESTQERVENPAAKVLKQGTVVGLANHTVLISADGRQTPIDDSGAPIKDKEGAIVGVVMVFRDVTERRRNEDALRSSEARFSKAFSATPLAKSISRFSDRRFIDVNDSFLRVTGYSRDEVLGRTGLELGIWPTMDERERVPRIDDEHASIREVECRLRLKSGELHTFLLWAELIEIGGEKCVLTVMNDVSERKLLEEQLLQAQKMEAVGRLAGGVAHDFNNLLTAIIGYSDLLLQDIKGNEKLRANVQEIRKAGKRAATLTSQLLSFSRKQVMQPKLIDLNEIVTDLNRMLKRLIGEDIELVSLTRSKLGQVKADPGRIEQVLVNLAVNSRDAMPRGGQLTIETSNVWLDEEYARHHAEVSPGKYVMMAVSDTGCGMDSETMSHIFEPFFTTKEDGKGTGLGLATVYGIVKQSGGHIWIYSEPGQGTTFKIYFPRVIEEIDSFESSAHSMQSQSGTETLLLVEDDEQVRNLARMALETSGYIVLEAADGAEALEKSMEYNAMIELMVTDVIMPRMSGRELAEKMSQQRPGMKVLYMSGYTDNAIVHHGVLDSGVVFLQKPFSPGEICRKVREVLNAEQP